MHIHTIIIYFSCIHAGGITTLAIDRDALDEYSHATESIANLDEFMARMTRDDIIPSDVRLRCDVEVTHVRNSTQVGKIVYICVAIIPRSSHVFQCSRGTLKNMRKAWVQSYVCVCNYG